MDTLDIDRLVFVMRRLIKRVLETISYMGHAKLSSDSAIGKGFANLRALKTFR